MTDQPDSTLTESTLREKSFPDRENPLPLAGMPTRLVAIAVPPSPLREELETLREELSFLSGSMAALKYPVHLTLRTGFLLPPGAEAELGRELAAWCSGIFPFDIRLGEIISSSLPADGGQGAGKCFAGFRVHEDPALMDAHSRLAAFDLFRKGPQYPWHPHVTLCFDDLDQTGLARIVQAVEKRRDCLSNRSWKCRELSLYHMVQGKWAPHSCFTLGI